MPIPNKLKRLADERGIKGKDKVEKLVAEALTETGGKIHFAAIKLEVYPRTITFFLEQHPDFYEKHPELRPANRRKN